MKTAIVCVFVLCSCARPAPAPAPAPSWPPPVEVSEALTAPATPAAEVSPASAPDPVTP